MGFFPDGGRGEAGAVLEEGVDHGVADEEDALFRDAGLSEVGVGDFGGGEEIVGDAVGDHAVDLLGHAEVMGADAGFDVGDFHAHFLGDDGAGHGGGDIAYDEAEVGRGFHQELFVAGHDAGGLLCLCAGAGIEVDIGLGDAELLEEVGAHFFVVVLAGVDEAVGKRSLLFASRGSRLAIRVSRLAVRFSPLATRF